MTIYYILNTKNDKTYIGQTRKKVKKRYKEHKKLLRKDSHFNNILQSSWKKHGEKAFKFGVLEDGIETLEDLNEAEEFWVTNLRSMYFQWGYNLKWGGGSHRITEEIRRRMSENHHRISGEDHYLYNNGEASHFYGKKRPKHSEYMRGEDNPFYGEQHSDVNKKKMSRAKGGKPVLHIKTGKIYPTQQEAARKTGVGRSLISYHCLKAKNKRFKYIEG